MGSSYSEFLRFFSFSVVTIAQILLGIFLLFHGSETLKFFGFFLLFIEIIFLIRLYFQITNIRNFRDI